MIEERNQIILVLKGSTAFFNKYQTIRTFIFIFASDEFDEYNWKLPHFYTLEYKLIKLTVEHQPHKLISPHEEVHTNPYMQLSFAPNSI